MLKRCAGLVAVWFLTAAGCVSSTPEAPPDLAVAVRAVPSTPDGDGARRETVALTAAGQTWTAEVVVLPGGQLTSRLVDPTTGAWSEVDVVASRVRWRSFDGVELHEVEALIERGTVDDLAGSWPDVDLHARAAGSVAAGVDAIGERALRDGHVLALAAVAGSPYPNLPAVLDAMVGASDLGGSPAVARAAVAMMPGRACAVRDPALRSAAVQVRLPPMQPTATMPWKLYTTLGSSSTNTDVRFECDASVGFDFNLSCRNGLADVTTKVLDTTYTQLELISDDDSDFNSSQAHGNPACQLIGWDWTGRPDRAATFSLRGGQIKGGADGQCVGETVEPAVLPGGCRAFLTGAWEDDVYVDREAGYDENTGSYPVRKSTSWSAKPAIGGKTELSGHLAVCEEDDLTDANDIAVHLRDVRLTYATAGCDEELADLTPVEIKHLEEDAAPALPPPPGGAP